MQNEISRFMFMPLYKIHPCEDAFARPYASFVVSARADDGALHGKQRKTLANPSGVVILWGRISRIEEAYHGAEERLADLFAGRH